jgi:glutathione S-transferase
LQQARNGWIATDSDPAGDAQARAAADGGSFASIHGTLRPAARLDSSVDSPQVASTSGQWLHRKMEPHPPFSHRKENRMKLYFSPEACSLSPHIVLNELGLPFTTVNVDMKTKKTADGRDFAKINPKGYVPALELDSGEILSEGPAIVQYLADLKPEKKLAPVNGSIERVRLQEWLNFITSELHKSYSPLFNPAMPAAAKAIFKDKLEQRYAFIARTLDRQDYLLGAHFSVADAYLFVVTRWAAHFDIDVKQWPSLAKFMERVGARAAVKLALNAESQAKKAA